MTKSGRANASVLIDALHFSRRAAPRIYIAGGDPALLRYAQICDASADVPGPTDTPDLIREARTGRLLPGEGALPLARAGGGAAGRRAARHRGAVRATAELPLLTRAQRAWRSMQALLDTVNDGLAGRRGFVHEPARVGRKGVAMMHRAAVIPHEQIPDPPLVLPHVFVLARMRPYLVEQRFAFVDRQTENVRHLAAAEV